MALNIRDIEKQASQRAGGSSGGSSSGSDGSVSHYQSGSSTSIFEYNKKSAKEVAGTLKKYKELFGRNIMDGACDVKGLINNKDWRVDMDIDGDGVVDEDIALAEAVARSFDSELDLYIQEKLEGLFEKYNCYNLRSLFGKADGEAIRELERLGIRADAVGDEDAWQNRTYAFSLVDLSGFENKGRFDELMSLVDEGKELSVDEKEELEKLQTELHDYLYSEDAKILEDGNGKKGSIIFADCLVPDGHAQGAELNLNSILDELGYECLSKADFANDDPTKGFTQEDYFNLLESVENSINNNEYDAKQDIENLYGRYRLDISTAVRAVYTANGNAYGSYSDGYWGKAISFEENLNRIEKFGLGKEVGDITTVSYKDADGNTITREFKETLETLKNAKENADNKQAYIDELVAKGKAEYKAEHGEEATGIELTNIEKDAELKANTKFGIQ